MSKNRLTLAIPYLQIAFVFSIVCGLAPAFVNSQTVNFQIINKTDIDSFNIATPNSSFGLDLKYAGAGLSGSDRVQYRWVKYWQDTTTGSGVTSWANLTGTGNNSGGSVTAISSPYSSMDTGYYGLQFRLVDSGGTEKNALFNTDDSSGVSASNRNELGFGVMNPNDSSLDPWLDSHFGMVWGNQNDPYNAPVFTKNFTDRQYRSSSVTSTPASVFVGVNGTAFKADLNSRYDSHGQRELPLVYGYKNSPTHSYWTTDDTKPITDWTQGSGMLPAGRSNAKNLSDLGSVLNQYSYADYNNSPSNDSRRLLGWELGLEEQLVKNASGVRIIDMPYYYTNLGAKIDKVRTSIDNEYLTGYKPKLAYQVVNPGDTYDTTISRLGNNGILGKLDVLSVHLYDWNDFRNPDDWIVDQLSVIKSKLDDFGQGDKEVWITEIGAPHKDAMNADGSLVQQYSGSVAVDGVDRNEAVAFNIKAHMLSLATDRHGLNVKKVFWYGQEDRKDVVNDVESHFGLVDNWGFVKPSYVANSFMTKLLRNLTYDTSGDVDTSGATSGDEISWFRFQGGPSLNDEVVVAWRLQGDDDDRVDFSDLGILVDGFQASHFQGAFSSVGSQRSLVDSTGVKIGYHPVYLYLSKNAGNTLVSVPEPLAVVLLGSLVLGWPGWRCPRRRGITADTTN